MKRWIIWILGINILAFGVVLNTKTGLGCAAVSSVNYVISRLLPIGFGTASTLLYLVLIAIQLLIVKRLEKGILAQIPFSILFGWITDIYDTDSSRLSENTEDPRKFNIPWVFSFCQNLRICV